MPDVVKAIPEELLALSQREPFGFDFVSMDPGCSCHVNFPSVAKIASLVLIDFSGILDVQGLYVVSGVECWGHECGYVNIEQCHP